MQPEILIFSIYQWFYLLSVVFMISGTFVFFVLIAFKLYYNYTELQNKNTDSKNSIDLTNKG